MYDDYGMLRYVISPKASNRISTDFTKSRTDDVIKDLCYYYEYDQRHRMIMKQLPDSDPVYMVYDDRDRLVLTQDGKIRDEDPRKWFFTKYDDLNRPVLTGIYTHSSSLSQSDMQVYVNTVFGTGRTYFVTRNNSVETGYADGSFPSASDGAIEYLTATYYDTYGFPGAQGFDPNVNVSIYRDSDPGNEAFYFGYLKGQTTGNRVKVLNSSTWLTSTIYYDDKYRAIQTCRDLYDGSNGGKEFVSNQYDFTGKIKKSRQKQLFNNVETYLGKRFEYDLAGRLTMIRQLAGTNTNDSVTVSQTGYNEIGQLQHKLIGNKQDVDYNYNIRGWLTSINNPDNLANDGTGDANADLFGMRLNYNRSENIGEDQFPQYNGNISQNIWKTQSSNKQGYSYDYYANNTLYTGSYSTNVNGTWSDNSLGFEGRIDGYDENGNPYDIRRGLDPNGTFKTYYFDYRNGNQLMTLYDDSWNPYTYTYDKSGNMTHDGLRNFNFTYNILNLPQTISKGSDNLSYIYSATGEKLAKLKNGVAGQYYCGNMVYNTAKNLDYIQFEEGIIKNVSSLTYEYYLKDHLGNTRVVFNGSGTVEQSNDYYPFGLSFPGSAQGITKYLYNGKELQDENLGGTAFGMYDYGARFYDPEIGRWLIPDPLVEDDDSWSPYNYVRNNPISHNDPDGRFWNYIGGALLGAAVDYVGQVGANLATGSGWSDALTNVNVGSIIISAGEGALTSGASVFSGAAKSGVRVTAKVVIKEAVKEGVKEGSGKVLDNAIKGKNLTEGVVQEATVGAVASTVSLKKNSYADKQKVVKRMESKSNPTHRQQNIAKTNMNQIKSTQVSNTSKTTTNAIVKNTGNNAVNKVKDDEKK